MINLKFAPQLIHLALHFYIIFILRHSSLEFTPQMLCLIDVPLPILTHKLTQTTQYTNPPSCLTSKCLQVPTSGF